MKKNPAEPRRYAIYARLSSEMQNELSLDAQEQLCREEIARRGGSVTAVYRDNAKSGWSLDREGFIAMQKGAANGLFDAVMFWKFDRLARDHNHAMMIKLLLRHEYGLKLFCVEGFSEDDNDDIFMEQMLAIFSAFYSHNLSSETRRGKKHRVMNGEFNGSIPPLGYDLVILARATPERPAGLHINPRAAALVRRAFRLYATGRYSDADIANWMNTRPYLQRLREGQMPFGKEMVRDMLQNRVYTGRVSYSETAYNGTLGQGKKSNRNRRVWFEGKHQGFISDELFDLCLNVRAGMVSHYNENPTERSYTFHDRVFCGFCLMNKPEGIVDANYGRMRPKFSNKMGCGHYHCLAVQRGYARCGQSQIPTHLVDEQVLAMLSTMVIPAEARAEVEAAILEKTENQALFQQMADVQAIVQKIDFGWEKGLLSQQEYISKRQRLEQEMAGLDVNRQEPVHPASLLDNFKDHWDACANTADPELERQKLAAQVVKAVVVRGSQIIAVILYGDFVLFSEQKIATQFREAILDHLLFT